MSTAWRTATVYICAAIGGFVAAIADMVQKEDASAIAKMTSVSARHMAVTMQPHWILLLLVILATALCFVFQPTERKQSFGVGVGIIAAIMTVTPYKQPPTGAPLIEKIDRGHLGALLHYAQANVADVFEVQAANLGQSAAVVGVSVFLKSSSQELYQKNVLEPGSAGQFRFDLKDSSASDRIGYLVDVNGIRLQPRELEVGRGPLSAVPGSLGS
jgi:hypothetical protein